MNRTKMLTVVTAAALVAAVLVVQATWAQPAPPPTTEPLPPPAHWHAASFAEAIMATAVFGVVGIVLAVFGFKLFDWCTPGDLQKEIIEKQNLSAGLLGGAIVLGVCLIIASVVS